MPLYEFKCNKCGLKYEVLCKVGEVVECLCGSLNVEKLISGFGVSFTNPKENSKYHDNFVYRAGVNAEKAKTERRRAQKLDHMGPNPYNDPDTVVEN